MKYLYYITQEKFVSNIIANGLKKGLIFLTNDVGKTLSSTEFLNQGKNLFILKINIEGLEIENENEIYICRTYIDFNRIEVVACEF